MKQLITNINVEMMVEILDIEIDFCVQDRLRGFVGHLHLKFTIIFIYSPFCILIH